MISSSAFVESSSSWRDHPLLKKSQPSWSPNLDFQAIEKRLASEKIVLLIPMRDYLTSLGKKSDFQNQVYLALLESGLKAVFKPDSEEQGMYGEVAAYRASQWMKAFLIPPTVLRRFNAQKGSLQFFVETPIDTATPEQLEHYLQKLDEKSREEMALFCFLFGKWDKGPGNILFVPSASHLYPVLIDNADLIQQQHIFLGQDPFVRKIYCDNRNDKWSTSFPIDKAQTISLEEIDHHPEFKACHLSAKNFPALIQSQKPLKYVFWRNSLWFQPFQPYSKILLSIQKLPPSLYQHLQSLNSEVLKEIWKEHPKSWSPHQFKEIIRLTLERRDQLLTSFRKKASF